MNLTTTSNNDTVDYTGDTDNLLHLLVIENKLSLDFLRGAINKYARRILDDLTNEVGMFLCSEDLNAKKQSEDDIRTLVQCAPTALSYKNGCCSLPIQHNAASYSFNNGGVAFLPVLIEEGMKYNVGGDGMRGGLICEHEANGTTGLMMLSSWGGDATCCGKVGDLLQLDVMKRLREMGLFKKEDIKEYNLLWGDLMQRSIQRDSTTLRTGILQH